MHRGVQRYSSSFDLAHFFDLKGKMSDVDFVLIRSPDHR
jgi:hypothetical protein